MNINFKEKKRFVKEDQEVLEPKLLKACILWCKYFSFGSNEKKLANFSKQFSSPLLYFPADLSKYNDIEQLVEKTLKSLITN